MPSRKVRAYIIVVLAVAVSASLILGYALGVFSQDEVVKIGVIVPLTGSSAHLADIMDGLELAANKLNSWGGLNGAKIELVVRDSGSDPNVSATLFEEIERDHHPLLFISAACSCTSPLILLAEERQVPLIGIATANVIGFEGSNWSFRYYPGTDKEIAPAMSIMESLGVTTLGIMRSDNANGYDLSSYLAAEFEAAGGSVEVITYCCKDSDIPDKAGELAENEAIFIAADYKATQAGLAAIRECGYTGHVFASSAASPPGTTSMPEAEGLYVSAPAVYNPNYLPARTLISEFVDAYGHNMTHYAASGYDAMNLIYGLMKDKELTREVMRDQLHGGFSYASVMGAIRVAEGSHDIQYDLFRAQVLDGRLWYL